MDAFRSFISINIARSFHFYNECIRCLEELEQKSTFWELTTLYYLARGYIKGGRKHHERALFNSRRLAGPVEKYVLYPERVIKWREELLRKEKILVQSETLDGVKMELLEDEVLRRWLDQEEIERILPEKFEEQKKGRRRLPNIKLRIALDKLKEIDLLAREREEKAKRYYLSKAFGLKIQQK